MPKNFKLIKHITYLGIYSYYTYKKKKISLKEVMTPLLMRSHTIIISFMLNIPHILIRIVFFILNNINENIMHKYRSYLCDIVYNTYEKNIFKYDYVIININSGHKKTAIQALNSIKERIGDNNYKYLYKSIYDVKAKCNKQPWGGFVMSHHITKNGRIIAHPISTQNCGELLILNEEARDLSHNKKLKAMHNVEHESVRDRILSYGPMNSCIKKDMKNKCCILFVENDEMVLQLKDRPIFNINKFDVFEMCLSTHIKDIKYLDFAGKNIYNLDIQNDFDQVIGGSPNVDLSDIECVVKNYTLLFNTI